MTIEELIAQELSYIGAQYATLKAVNEYTRLVHFVRNIKEFGAVGDGIADDTVAIQNAINTVPAGSTIYFPNGVYKTTATITITKPINIIGESKFNTIIMGTGLSQDISILSFDGTTDNKIQNISIENISLWSDNNLARGITYTWVNKSNFSNLYFYNLYNGLYGDYSWGNNFRNLSVYGITNKSVIINRECNNVHFDKCEFRGATGLEITGNNAGIKLTACDFEGIGSGYGLNIVPATGNFMRNIVVDGCYFENIQGSAIHTAGVDADSTMGLVVKGSYFFGGHNAFFSSEAGKASNAIILSKVTGFDISDNVFIDWETNAIFRDSSESKGKVWDNILSNTPNLTNSSNQMSASVDIQNNSVGRKVEYYNAIPTTGTYSVNDEVRNTTPSELGTAGSKYIITGWKCIAAGSPGTWVPMRTLTGN